MLKHGKIAVFIAAAAEIPKNYLTKLFVSIIIIMFTNLFCRFCGGTDVKYAAGTRQSALP